MDVGGYFCVLLVSLPNVYPAQKQVMPKLTTAMKSTILGISHTNRRVGLSNMCYIDAR